MSALRSGVLVAVVLGSGVACAGNSTVDGNSDTGGAQATGGATADSGGTGAGATGSGAASNGGEPGTGGAGTPGGSGGDASGGSNTGGAGGAELSGPTPIADPDFVASVSAYDLAPPSVSVWRRYKAAVPIKEENCPTELVGDCAIFSCQSGVTFEGVPDPDGFGQDFVDAGTISVSYVQGGEVFSASVTPDDTMSVFNASFLGVGETLLGGEPLTFSLSGGDVPALARTIPFPARLVTTTAGAATAETSVIQADRSVDLHLDWDNGAPGVLYQVTGGLDTGPNLLYCEFASELGTGTIPSSLLGKIGSGSRLSTITASAWRGNLDGYDVSLATGAETVTEDGLHVFIQVF